MNKWHKNQKLIAKLEKIEGKAHLLQLFRTLINTLKHSNRMKYIVLDTNFIMSAIGFKIDIIREIERIADFRYKLTALKATLSELEKLIKEGEYFERKQALLAMQVIKKSRMDILPMDGYADDILAALDPQTHVIATQDAGLLKRLKQKGFKTIIIRQKTHFELC